MNEATILLSPLSIILVLVSGLGIALSLSFLVIIAWYDIRRGINQFLALLLIASSVWHLATVMLELSSALNVGGFYLWLIRINSVSFSITSVVTYIFSTILTGNQPRFFKWISVPALGVVIAINFILPLNNLNDLRSITFFFWLSFAPISLIVLWRYRRKVEGTGIIFGLAIVMLGQGISFLNPNLNTSLIASSLSSLGIVMICFAFLEVNLIRALVNQQKQLGTLQQVGVAITTRIATDQLLDEIVRQAITWVGGDASALFLRQKANFVLITLYQLPVHLHGRVAVAGDITDTIVNTQKARLIESYQRKDYEYHDFEGVDDTFGSVIGMPMHYDEQVIGVLYVIASKHGKRFSQNDVQLLNLLGSQAAVAIGQDTLFNQQVALTDDLRVAHEQLQTMVRMTSHDLKNPLQAATANLDLLKDDIVDLQNSGEIQLSVQNIEKQIQRMYQIINEILDLERIRLGINLLDICDSSDLIYAAIDEVHDNAKNKRIHIVPQLEIKGLFYGNRHQFIRALVNLLDNAIKFSPNESRIYVHVSIENQEILFNLKDEGVGIPLNMHSLVFERFYRGKQQGIEHVAGSGLGLSIVKAVVELHKGRIWIDSDYQSGTSFVIAVPLINRQSLQEGSTP